MKLEEHKRSLHCTVEMTCAKKEMLGSDSVCKICLSYLIYACTDLCVVHIGMVNQVVHPVIICV